MILISRLWSLPQVLRCAQDDKARGCVSGGQQKICKAKRAGDIVNLGSRLCIFA